MTADNSIARLAYELYKIQWMKRIPAKVQMDAYKNWHEEEFEPQLSQVQNPYNGECDDYYDGQTFEEWIEEHGYEGFGIYICYEEFCTNEFQNEEYIKELLDNTALYLRYLKEVAA